MIKGPAELDQYERVWQYLNSPHEAWGRCGSCGWPVHRYSAGWEHTDPLHDCDGIEPTVTCCTEHVIEEFLGWPKDKGS